MVILANILDPELVTCVGIGMVVLTVIVNIMLAIGVMQDAAVLERRRQRLWFIGPILWGLATLITGLMGATAYWLMHRSSLSVVSVEKIVE